LSPDAQTVIFPAFTPERTRSSMMFVDRRKLTAEFPFLEQFRNWNITGVDWSPDGKTIAFTATTPPEAIEWPLE
jgi:Tol biopolymer transport system component